MLLTVCYIIFVIVLCSIFRRYEKKAEEKYDFGSETPEGRKERFFAPPKKISSLTKLVIAGMAVFVGFVIFIFDAMTEEYWLFFGEDRTAKIEEKYGLTVDYNVDLKKYSRIGHGQAGTVGKLEFETDLDGLTFMQKNCKGELIKYAEDGVMHYPAAAKTEDAREPEEYSMKSGAVGQYWYKTGSKEYIMTFYKDDESYFVRVY